ncbi:unnamed protein product, partial [Rotaria magnacalcarata]
GVTSNSICSKSSEKEEIDDHSSLSSRGGRPTDDDNDNDNDDDNESMIPISEEANSNTLIRQPSSNTKRQGNCLTSMEAVQERNYLSKCSCESHLATQLIDRTYSLSVERLFDYLFGENDFVNAYHESRRIKDFHTDEWKINEKTGKRERVCTYKVSVTAVFGETTICSNEKQVVICELSKSHYIVDTEVRNEGIKYANAFFVASRYCLVQLGLNKSHLKVICEKNSYILYANLALIENNTKAALQNSYIDWSSKMVILLSVNANIFLWLKLNQIDRMTDRLVQNYPLWSNGYSYPKEEYQWSLLLKRQEEYYQTKLNGLRSVLILTHNAFKKCYRCSK